MSSQKSPDPSSSTPDELTEEDLRAVVRKSSLSDALWRQFVGSHQRHATLTRWADALAGDAEMAPIVQLLRAHSALKQRRFSVAVEAFEKARSQSFLGPTDYLALAAALRGGGDHAAAIQALADGDRSLYDQEFIYWKAVSLMAMGREAESSVVLSAIEPSSRDANTSWLAAYLSSALKYPSVAPSPALSERYSGIATGDTAEVVFAVLDLQVA